MALRTAIVFTFLLIAVCSFAQSFEGGFVHHEPGTKDEQGYYFWKDGEFSWFQVKDGKKELGTGKYKLLKDSLLLNFGPAQLRFDVQVETASSQPKSKIIVGLNAMSATGAPYAGLKFTLQRSKVVGETDRMGSARVQINNPPKRDSIQFDFKGYNTSPMAVELNGMDVILALVVDDTIKYVENTSLRFKIRRSSKKMDLTDGNRTMSFTSISLKKFNQRLR